MDLIFSILGKIVIAVGGAGIVILGLSSWIGKIWADKLMETQKHQNQKDIEEYKSKLAEQLEILKFQNEKYNHISKVQFDAAFKMYQEINENMFNAVLSLDVLLIKEEDIDEDIIEEYFSKCQNDLFQKINIFQKNIRKFAPFIDKEIYKSFLVLAKSIVKLQSQIPTLSDYLSQKDEVKSQMNEAWETHNQIVDILRNYLNTLKVQEDKE